MVVFRLSVVQSEMFRTRTIPQLKSAYHFDFGTDLLTIGTGHSCASFMRDPRLQFRGLHRSDLSDEKSEKE
nr:hypothetical protein CFP56_04293 [Quercus suber]